MIYTIEFELPDNETVKKQLKYCPVHWQIWGYCGDAVAKPKTDIKADTPLTERPSCESCKWDSEEWYDRHCDSCVAHTDKPSNYEPKAEIPKNALRSDCMGCRFVGTYDTEFPCANCTRKNKDYYDADRPQK